MKYSKFTVISAALTAAAVFRLFKRLKEIKRREEGINEILREEIIPLKRYRDDHADAYSQEFVSDEERVKMAEFDDVYFSDYYSNIDNLFYHVEPGDIFLLGSYPQNEDKDEPIEWLVLDREGDEVLLLSRYGLDCQPYNTDYRQVGWETCSLRKWLNSTFYETAFSSIERGVIIKTAADKYEYPYHQETLQDSDTADKVFLLTETDCAVLFDSAEERICTATQYANAQGAYKSKDGNALWWLRIIEKEPDFMYCVGCLGFIVPYAADDTRCSVRPAIRINMDAARWICAEEENGNHKVWSLQPEDSDCLIKVGEIISLKDREGKSETYQVSNRYEIEGCSCVEFTQLTGDSRTFLITKEVNGEFIDIIYGKHYHINNDESLSDKSN